jgi:hypothetical protein
MGDRFLDTVPAVDAGVHNCGHLAARCSFACVLVLPYQLVAAARRDDVVVGSLQKSLLARKGAKRKSNGTGQLLILPPQNFCYWILVLALAAKLPVGADGSRLA